MRNNLLHGFFARSARPLAVVLGTNEIASAVAVRLQRAEYSVVLSHDPFPPVIRRAMSFHDALFGERAIVEGIEADCAASTIEIASTIVKPNRVAVTALHFNELLAIRTPDVLLDARMQKHRVTPRMCGIVPVTVGLGPNFIVGVNCDIAVETRPAKNGSIVRDGVTDPADDVARQLGGVGRERFVYSNRDGLWRTNANIGTPIFKGLVVGYLDGVAVEAPIDGVLRGVARDGTEVPFGVKLVEIDPRGRQATWTNTDERGRRIAEATVKAIQMFRTSGNVRRWNPQKSEKAMT